MNYDDLVHRLRGLAEAYPEDVFPDFTKKFSADERKKHQILITLVSASMGRHFGKFFTEAADAIQELQRDALRYRWLRDCPDDREVWAMGPLRNDPDECTHGTVDGDYLDELIDEAMQRE